LSYRAASVYRARCELHSGIWATWAALSRLESCIAEAAG